jgi:hypothetical protein
MHVIRNHRNLKILPFQVADKSNFSGGKKGFRRRSQKARSAYRVRGYIPIAILPHAPTAPFLADLESSLQLLHMPSKKQRTTNRILEIVILAAANQRKEIFRVLHLNERSSQLRVIVFLNSY